MATKKRREDFSLDIEIDGILQSQTRAKITKEFIKFIIHQRNQIPLCFDLLEKAVKEDKTLASQEISEGRPKRGAIALERTKKQRTLESLQAVFSTLDQIFSVGHSVRRVLLMFGASIVSPREIYMLTFPEGFYDGKMAESKNCMRTIFQNLVHSDMTGTLKEIRSLIKLTILVEAPRDSLPSQCSLLVKNGYKIPNRGQRFNLNLLSVGKFVDLNHTRAGETDFEMSGIAPLDQSGIHSVGSSSEHSSNHMIVEQLGAHLHNSLVCQTPKVMAANSLACQTPVVRESNNSVNTRQQRKSITTDLPDCSKTLCSTPDVGVMDVDCPYIQNISPDLVNSPIVQIHVNRPRTEDTEYVWHQLPQCVKGYRDKTSKVAKMSDLFGM